jgi:uncharacterized delta-60 repeat protein
MPFHLDRRLAHLCGLLLLGCSSASFAAADDADLRFGAGGRVTVDIAPEPDGRDYLLEFGTRPGGYVALDSRRDPSFGTPSFLRRYDADGTFLDESRLPSSANGVYATALTPAGGVVYAETDAADDGHRFFIVHRRLPDGSADPSFGDGTGRRVIDEGNVDLWPEVVSVDADGRIVVAGTTVPFGVPSGDADDTFVYSLLADGSIDTEFGAFGMGYLSMSPDYRDLVNAVIRDDSGRVHVCGAGFRDGSTDAVVARFNAAGDLDPTFGSGGLLVLDTSTSVPPLNATDECKRLALHPNSGRVYMATRRGIGNPHVNTVRVYGIGETGTVSSNVVDVLESADYSADIGFTFDADARALVAAAIKGSSGGINAALARLLSPSQRDTSFAVNGETRYSFVHAGALRKALDVRALLVDDGRILLGTSYSGDGPGFDPNLWSVLALQGDRVFADGFE